MFNFVEQSYQNETPAGLFAVTALAVSVECSLVSEVAEEVAKEAVEQGVGDAVAKNVIQPLVEKVMHKYHIRILDKKDGGAQNSTGVIKQVAETK
ncbi:hypothetical protein WN55_09715 [Dufourea novaeangliae]|uniref:Uncharacterized protein n=1 Tax=Dufourea novaeangliae TaxID=178035 RepID=A0A154NZ17_DUFNO|nr:hypothetical protein WN55_09715 [Dufourea novaeangliae]